jgi:hypothetical protein
VWRGPLHDQSRNSYSIVFTLTKMLHTCGARDGRAVVTEV